MADQNLKQIQFKRTSTENKAPGADIVARGEIVLNTHGRTLAIYTKDEDDNVVQLAGKGVPFLDTAGNLNVDGTTTLKDNVTISPNKAINFEATDLSGAIVRHIVGKCATNDGWYIGAGGTSNSGILEIGTIDDGAETIQFVQRGAGNVEARKLVLLDGSGNTTLPGDLRLSTNKTVKINNGSTLVLEMGVGSNDVYIKNQRGVGVLQLTNDSNLTFRNSQVYYAMNGRGPGKSGTLLTNVENNRQAWQYVISAATAGTPRWVKVATIKHPGDASSQLDLMITGGIDSGHGRHYVDFITLSGRNLTSWSTSNLDNWVEWRRIGSPNKGNVPEYYVVKNDAATDSEASFDFYAKVPRYGNGLYVTVLNTAGYNGQDSGKVIIYETGQDTGATGQSGSILVSMKQIFDSSAKPDFGDTTGTLPVNRGGTGATNVGDARNNLGLGTAAVRDVGEGAGNLLENGAYGLGGNGGKSIEDIVSNVDMMTRLKAYGGTFWRGVTKSGVSVQNGLYSHGSGIFMNAGDTMSAINIDYASAKVRVYAANNSGLAAGNVRYNELYGTANKPTKADVGLGNLTNDTQVKKAGDTMTGDLAAPNLHASGSGTASVYVNAGTGNAHVWFRTDANERGVIWATPNTADLGQINIRAKTTGNTSAGDFSFRSDGRLDVPVAVKVGGAAMLTKDGNITSGSMFGGNLNNYLNTIKNDIVAGDNKQVSKTGDTMTGNLTINANLKVENPNGSMVDLGSENSDKYSRLTLARKVGSGASVAMLKITPEGYVQFGYQDAVANPSPSKYIRVKPDGLDVEGDLVFNQTYRGTEEAVDISDKTVDLNGLVIKRTDPGTRQLYKCVSSGGGSNISNKPTSDGNFVLEVLSLRKVSDTDWSCKQTFTTKNGGVEGTYVRYGQNGSWSAWKEVVAGVQPINLGGTGATSAASARNNLGVGEGQSVKFGWLVVNGVGTSDPTITFKNGAVVREAQGGSTGALIMSASATAATAAKYIAFRPYGDSSNSEIRVKAFGNNETSLEWSQGAGVRSNTQGAFVVYAKAGQALHLRPNGDSANQSTVIDQNGKMTVGGEFEAQNSKITGNLNVSEDNRMIVLGKNSDIGLVKKNGMPGKMAIGKSNSFTVMVSANTNNQINPADTFSDIFKVDANGNQTVYGNAQINRQLTVSSSATVAGAINANGGIIVPTTKYVQIADAPTQNNQATNKKYVDDKVASAISNAGDTYLPLAGGTVTGSLDVTGTRLKTWRLEVDGGGTVLGGTIDVAGKAVFSKDILVEKQLDVRGAGACHLRFSKADGSEKGLIYADDDKNVSIRSGGDNGPSWNFWSSGSCQFPGAISNYNGISSTTYYPGGNKNDYLNTAGLVSRFSNGAYASLYFQEYVGNYHQAILNVNGYGEDDSFYFRSGGDFFCTRNGSFDNVEIRSDRRAKSDIKVIENALEKVETLSGNTYVLHNTSGGTTRSAGLIAQEVQEVLPEAVTQDIEADGGLLRLNYNSVIALLVESVKELSAEVKGLKAEIEELKSK
ncbi:L-shaped tail fiber protein [Klebsiella phage vB_KpnM_5N]|nr:L-shaped tail fiber protein [Klebsiella phage vB_KpnM_5N]